MPVTTVDVLGNPIGGTINQGMQRIGMGADDSAYMMQRAQEAARAINLWYLGWACVICGLVFGGAVVRL